MLQCCLPRSEHKRHLARLVGSRHWAAQGPQWRVLLLPGSVCMCMCLHLSIPEEALAALAGHGIEVESGGLVPAHTADPRHVPVKLIIGQSGGTHSRSLHYYRDGESEEEERQRARERKCERMSEGVRWSGREGDREIESVRRRKGKKGTSTTVDLQCTLWDWLVCDRSSDPLRTYG